MASRKRKNVGFSEPVRAWLYRISTPGIPLLVAYGVVTEEKAPLWAAFIAAALTSGLAAVNTSTKS